MDITEHVQGAVKGSGLESGIAAVFVLGSTAAVTTIGHEPGLVHDFTSMLGRVSPRDFDYEHQKAWHDDNGRSHVKASLVGPLFRCPSSGVASS